MQFNNPYWSPKTKIELLQRWILVHSYLYYELDYNVVSDHMFDNNCVQLNKMKEKYPKSYKRSRYYEAMKDFDGSTGFGFYEKLNMDTFELIRGDAHLLKERY